MRVMICTYCRDGNSNEIYLENNSGYSGLSVEIFDGELYVYFEDGMSNTVDCNIKINYCPMCGNKLKNRRD